MNFEISLFLFIQSYRTRILTNARSRPAKPARTTSVQLSSTALQTSLITKSMATKAKRKNLSKIFCKKMAVMQEAILIRIRVMILQLNRLLMDVSPATQTIAQVLRSVLVTTARSSMIKVQIFKRMLAQRLCNFGQKITASRPPIIKKPPPRLTPRPQMQAALVLTYMSKFT